VLRRPSDHVSAIPAMPLPLSTAARAANRCACMRGKRRHHVHAARLPQTNPSHKWFCVMLRQRFAARRSGNRGVALCAPASANSRSMRATALDADATPQRGGRQTQMVKKIVLSQQRAVHGSAEITPPWRVRLGATASRPNVPTSRRGARKGAPWRRRAVRARLPAAIQRTVAAMPTKQRYSTVCCRLSRLKKGGVINYRPSKPKQRTEEKCREPALLHAEDIQMLRAGNQPAPTMAAGAHARPRTSRANHVPVLSGHEMFQRRWRCPANRSTAARRWRISTDIRR